MRRVGLAVMLLAGCSRPAPVEVSGLGSAPGWAVRYNAALALANRGSATVTIDPVVQELLTEMLDYDLQLRNSRTEVRPGKEVANPAEASVTVAGAIHALGTFQRLKPDATLTPFRPALEKLAEGANKPLAREARTLLDRVWPPG